MIRPSISRISSSALLALSLGAPFPSCVTPIGMSTPSEEVRARMGVLGFAAIAPEDARLTTPAQGWAAGIAAGACDGWNVCWGVGSDPTADQAAIVAFLAPLGLVAGALYGPFGTIPADDFERAERILRESLRELPWPIEDELRAEVDSQTDYATDSGSGKPAECVMEVAALDCGLMGRFSLDPALAPFVKLRVCLKTASGRELLYEVDYREAGPARSFLEWASHSEELREEFARLRRSLVARIVEEVLLLCPPSDI